MGRTVALIDDSSVMRSILRKSIMMSSNLDVSDFVEAENGAKGLELIETNKSIDIIITDLHMPELGGVEMMEKLKANGTTKAPIVVISTVGDEKMQNTCKGLGAVAFLKKPFSHEDIEGLLTTVIKDHLGG